MPRPVLLVIVAGLFVSGCAGTPAAKLGDSLAHGASAIAGFCGSHLQSGAVLHITFMGGDVWVFPFVNNPPRATGLAK